MDNKDREQFYVVLLNFFQLEHTLKFDKTYYVLPKEPFKQVICQYGFNEVGEPINVLLPLAHNLADSIYALIDKIGNRWEEVISHIAYNDMLNHSASDYDYHEIWGVIKA